MRSKPSGYGLSALQAFTANGTMAHLRREFRIAVPCSLLLVARFKIGHTPRKNRPYRSQPPASSHIVQSANVRKGQKSPIFRIRVPCNHTTYPRKMQAFFQNFFKKFLGRNPLCFIGFPTQFLVLRCKHRALYVWRRQGLYRFWGLLAVFSRPTPSVFACGESTSLKEGGFYGSSLRRGSKSRNGHLRPSA